MSLGKWSVPLGVISCIWLFGSSCLLFLPQTNPVTPQNMNYLIVVVAGVTLIGAVNWLVSGRYSFKGPKRANHTA